MKKNIGLFFGTFNPIHIGHLAIANHFAEFTKLDEIWLVVTPQSPFKKKKSLLDNYQRLEMVYKACEEYPKLKPSNIEFNLPQPNYTINTLVHLEEKYPQDQFALIMGEDNLKSFHKWKNHEAIIDRVELYVYPRISVEENDEKKLKNPKIHFVEAPKMEISSTFIRKAIKEGKNVRHLLPKAVWEYIDHMNFYRNMK